MSTEITCHLCGAGAQKPLMALRGRDGEAYRAMRCPACGIVYADPHPVFAVEEEGAQTPSIASLYDEDYYQSNWGEEGLGYCHEDKLSSMLEESDRQREAIAAMTGLRAGCVLDIGCGDGRYLAGFRRAGWDVTGIEVSQTAARWARERFQLPVLEGALEELRLPDKHFDLVRLKHCIEHLTDPRAAARIAYSVLRPGGVAVIDTDNAAGLRSRMEICCRRILGSTAGWLVRKLMGKDLSGRYGRLTPPIHLFTFDPPSMRRLLENCGFETHALFTVPHGDPVWFPLVSRFRGHPLEVLFRLIDWCGWRFMGRGEALVAVVRKPK